MSININKLLYPESCLYDYVWEAPGETLDEKIQNSAECASKKAMIDAILLAIIVSIVVIFIAIFSSSSLLTYGSIVLGGLVIIGGFTLGPWLSSRNAEISGKEFKNKYETSGQGQSIVDFGRYLEQQKLSLAQTQAFTNNRGIRKQDIINVESLSLFQRINLLEKLKIDIFVCGGITRPILDNICNKNISVIPFVCGDVKELLMAIIKGKDVKKEFAMPGKSEKENLK